MDAEAVKRAYHRLAKEWHPDKWSHSGCTPSQRLKAEERFKRITVAHSELSDAHRRKKYDYGR